MSQYSQHWAEIEAGRTPNRGEFRVYSTHSSTAEGPVLLGIDTHGNRHILLPLRAGVVVEGDERSGGVQIFTRELQDADERGTFVDVACRKPHLFSVFDHFAAELIDAVAVDPGRPGTVARRTLNRWRELFDRAMPGILGPNEVTGLFGELHVLAQLVRESPGAMSAWTGPTGARFDFQAGTAALEVKTSTARDDLLVEIHGIDQLSPPAGGSLYLAVVAVEVLASGASLPELVGLIRAAGVDNVQFSEKLRSAGYSDADAPHYADYRFNVRALVGYEVDEHFPRIVRSSFAAGDVANGVSRIRYTLRLGNEVAQLESTKLERVLALFSDS